MRIVLPLLVAVSLFFHLFNLTQPPQAVFDEAHFATYASTYAEGRPHFDIHPPLGKIFYSLPLFLAGGDSPRDAEFVKLERDDSSGELLFSVSTGRYGEFPYFNLRLLSALVGVLLVAVVYFFIKAVSGSELAAALGAFFIVFENALLLESRFILLNGLYLTLGFLALTLFFKDKSRSVLAGVIWGLALSVKLVAVVFLAPVIVYVLLKDKKILGFLVSAAVTFLLIFIFANGLFVPAGERLAFYQSLGLPFAERQWSSSFWGQNFQAAVVELNVSLSGYTGGVRHHPDQSDWYGWPFMVKPIKYSDFGGKIWALIGNPAVWFLAVAAVLLSLIRFRKTSPVLLSGYFFSLAPFIFLSRPTFLYHYFPALIFGISLAAILIAEKLEKKWIVLICSATVLFFLAISPLTFGL